MSSNKEVIYIDTEDDITAVIDRLQSSKASILALVLPKRYMTLRSSVNMKLLKRTADKTKKKVVLITNDSALLPLAGTAGVFVADSLKSRPAVPKVEKSQTPMPVVENEDEDDDVEVGEVAAATAGVAAVKATRSSDKSAKIKSIKESSKIKVPNFDAFRVRIVLVVLAVFLLIGGWYYAFQVVPKANITVQAQTSRVATNLRFRVDPNIESDNIEAKIVKGQVHEISKTVTERFDATGEKDVGSKAKGTVTVTNCFQGSAFTLPAGTIFTDTQFGFEYESTSAVEVPGLTDVDTCATESTADVPVVATESGDNRNLSARGYLVEGVDSRITGFGSDMTGGTTKIVTVVSDDDIKKAKQLLVRKTDDDIRSELAAKFEEGDIIIDESFEATNDTAVSSVKAGTEATEGSVSAEFTYSIIGVSQESIDAVLADKQEQLVDSETQAILDNGASRLELEIAKTLDGGVLVVTGTTDGHVGPDIDTEKLASDVSGKRFSEAVDLITSIPGVNEVDVDLSPFWVFSVPDSDKTTITIEISDDTLQ